MHLKSPLIKRVCGCEAELRVKVSASVTMLSYIYILDLVIVQMLLSKRSAQSRDVAVKGGCCHFLDEVQVK